MEVQFSNNFGVIVVMQKVLSFLYVQKSCGFSQAEDVTVKNSNFVFGAFSHVQITIIEIFSRAQEKHT